MEEQTAGKPRAPGLLKGRSKIFDPVEGCSLKFNSTRKSKSRSVGSVRSPRADATGSTNLTAGKCCLTDLPSSLTTIGLTNEADSGGKRATRMKSVQLHGDSKCRVNIIRTLVIGAIAVSLLILAQQILKSPVQAAGNNQATEIGTTSRSVRDRLADFDVNSVRFITNELDDNGAKEDVRSGPSGDESGDEVMHERSGFIRSSRDLEQQRQQQFSKARKFLSGASFTDAMPSSQKVAGSRPSLSEPINPSSYQISNLVSDPRIGILNEVKVVYNGNSMDNTDSGQEFGAQNNNNNNNINAQHNQLIFTANPNEAIKIDKMNGVDISIARIMAMKNISPQGSRALEGNGRDSRSPSTDSNCKSNKFDEIIATKMRNNSLSLPIVKSDGRYDNPFPTWRSVGVMDLMKFVVTESDESGVPKSKEELDRELPILKPNLEVEPEKKENFRLTWIGHATTLIQIDGLNILTDPIFSHRASPVQIFGPQRYRDPACSVAELPRIDIVLISHNHYDHLDANSVRELNERFGDNCRWIVPLGIGEFLKSMSVNNYVELDWWQKDCFSLNNNEQLGANKASDNNSSISLPQKQQIRKATVTSAKQISGTTATGSQQQENKTSNRKPDTGDSEVAIYLTPNQHWSRRGVNDVCKTLWGSYVIVSKDGSTFFFAGDTGYCKAFREIRQVFGPMKGAAIPIGAYQPRWFMKYSHVDPHEAVQMHADLESAKSIAIHHSTFALANENYKEPARLLREVMIGRKETVKAPFITLKHGETTDF